MLIGGLDPGLDGALAVFDGYLRLEVADMPTLIASKSGKREVDPHALADLLRPSSPLRPAHMFLERVASSPQQGVSSAFSFGRSYGIVIGILAALEIPFTAVMPTVWKKATGTPAEKDGAVSRASQLMPTCRHLWPLKKHHGRAESFLIAWYGYTKLYPADARHGTAIERRSARDLFMP